jgi:Lipase (class 3)
VRNIQPRVKHYSRQNHFLQFLSSFLIMNLPFDISGDPLCLANIRACAEASRLAYSQPTITESGESVLIQEVGTAVPAVRSDSCLVIAFPGTHDLRDVLRHLDCVRVRATILGRPCSVHAGFARSHDALISKIIPACQSAGVVTLSPSTENSSNEFSHSENLNSPQSDSSPSPPQGGEEGRGEVALFRQPIRPLFLTGHSKGAAVAKRCALSLLEQNIPVHAVITFGEPRGGDSRYAALYRDVLGQRTRRVTNAADPVPWLPAWLAGNRHCGPEAWLPPDPVPQLIMGPRLWWKLAKNFREIYQAWQLKQLTPLNDHHIDNYFRRLEILQN